MVKANLNIVSGIIVALTVLAWGAMYTFDVPAPWYICPGVLGLVAAASPQLIQEWERGILLRLGKYKRILDPGVSWIIPGVDRITAIVDMRIRSTPFTAEKTLTRDTVPVNVDAVLFWIVTDAERAVLEVQEYLPTVSWAAQTTLRDVIGKTELVRMISDREILDKDLQTAIDAKTSEWGITVQSVEIRDVKIPGSLEDAMSRKAQADREREARIILAESEIIVAEEMVQAAAKYEQNEHAMQLRAMNMTYESIKENGALMVVPSGMAESLNTGVIGMAAAAFRTEPGPGPADGR